MKRLIFLLSAIVLPASALAAGSSFPLDQAHIDLENDASLQRGAKIFVNYCMGCHSAEHQRYNRFARDAGLTDEQVVENLIFTDAKVGDLMENAMPKEEAQVWFGAAPPDLTLIARSRGVDWLYTYLRTFYLDDTRPYGVNNAVFPSVGMPHVLWELQGWQKPVVETVTDAEGNEHDEVVDFELVSKGSMSPVEFDRAMRDLVNFLAYIAEPIRLEREALGIKVLIFVLLMIVVFYLLKKEYWRDVH